MEPEGNSTGNDHARDRRTRKALGVQHDEAGAACDEVVDEADEPSAVLDSRSAGIPDEQELTRMSAGTEVVTLPGAGYQIVLFDRGAGAGRHRVEEAVR